MVDRLAEFFEHYTFNTRVFYLGSLHEQASFDACGGSAYLHLIRRGTVIIRAGAHAPQRITEPSLLFCLLPEGQSFVTEMEMGADVVCAKMDFQQSTDNPLTKALPTMLLMPFHELPELLPTVELLFSEATQDHCGRQAAIDRLAGYLLIQILRYVMDHGKARIGLLAGLADKRLVSALTAMHQQAQEEWTVQRLADLAGMSRARFAVHFRKTLGITPGEYLTQWRIGLAQEMLKRGLRLDLIADKVGYGSATALSRVIRARTGQSPRDLKKVA